MTIPEPQLEIGEADGAKGVKSPETTADGVTPRAEDIPQDGEVSHGEAIPQVESAPEERAAIPEIRQATASAISCYAVQDFTLLFDALKQGTEITDTDRIYPLGSEVVMTKDLLAVVQDPRRVLTMEKPELIVQLAALKLMPELIAEMEKPNVVLQVYVARIKPEVIGLMKEKPLYEALLAMALKSPQIASEYVKQHPETGDVTKVATAVQIMLQKKRAGNKMDEGLFAQVAGELRLRLNDDDFNKILIALDCADNPSEYPSRAGMSGWSNKRDEEWGKMSPLLSVALATIAGKKSHEGLSGREFAMRYRCCEGAKVVDILCGGSTFVYDQYSPSVERQMQFEYNFDYRKIWTLIRAAETPTELYPDKFPPDERRLIFFAVPGSYYLHQLLNGNDKGETIVHASFFEKAIAKLRMESPL